MDEMTAGSHQESGLCGVSLKVVPSVDDRLDFEIICGSYLRSWADMDG